jgi:hypothetical protein
LLRLTGVSFAVYGIYLLNQIFWKITGLFFKEW